MNIYADDSKSSSSISRRACRVLLIVTTFVAVLLLFITETSRWPALDLAAKELNTSQASLGRTRTDRRVYPEPRLPALPRAGGKLSDPTFGTMIMRATDERDYRTPGCGTWYSQWPTFNSNNTRLLIR